MKTQSNYQKVASYEAKIGEVKKVLLLYSGGLDTSVMLKWIQDTYHASVITLTADLGQQADDLEAIREKALKFGAKKAIVLDLKDAFADEFIAKGIKANASYQGAYHLSTPIGRAILAREAVKVANKIGADAIAHGCTGKGNDQVRIDGYILAHDENHCAGSGVGYGQGRGDCVCQKTWHSGPGLRQLPLFRGRQHVGHDLGGRRNSGPIAHTQEKTVPHDIHASGECPLESTLSETYVQERHPRGIERKENEVVEAHQRLEHHCGETRSWHCYAP